MKTFILIDTSYAIFYRFFATKMWYKFAYPEEENGDDYDWMVNTVFKDMFEKKFYDSFHYCINKFNISSDNIIMVRDCPRADIWRNVCKKNYKSTRPHFNGGDFFKFTYNEILPNLLNEKKIKHVLKQDNMEADDVIALAKKHLQEKYEGCKIIIISSDHDLLQLIDNNTEIYSLKKKCINDKSTGDKYTDLHLKILCGDKSDNIDGCIPKCGPKTAMKLINDRDKLREKLLDPDIFKKYIENSLIIDFNNIPEYFQNTCNEYLKSKNL